MLCNLPKDGDAPFVFAAERGDGDFKGTKCIWAQIVRKADRPGVTPHTLRHTTGSTATSHGEALALTGAILGHSNPRSTAIYAHVQTDPFRRAANRVSRRIASALAGHAAAQSAKTKETARGATVDAMALARSLSARLLKEGIDSDRVQAILAEALMA